MSEKRSWWWSRAASPSRRRRRSRCRSAPSWSRPTVGSSHARALGLDVAVAVGDFDSASPEAVAAAAAEGTRVVRHPVDKDATDLELALDVAASSATERILVLAGGGGRLDHLLSALLLLGHERYASAQIDALVGPARVHVVRGTRTLAGEPGELVSLLALHGPAEGVRTDGLAYQLRGETLEPGSSRGVSNVFAANRATVSVRARRAARDPSGRRVTSEGLVCRKVLLALVWGAARRSPSRAAATTARRRRGRARHARLVRDLGRREGGVRAGERAHAPDPAVGRRERDADEGAPHRGQPAGGRALRRRRQPPLPGARRRPLRARTSRPALADVDERYVLDESIA